MRVADYVADFLVDNGITDVFSVVGGGAMHLNDALGHKDGLNVTYNHNEQGCSIAAEGYARASQRVAAVCVTTGPGGTNAITGVMGAWLDSIPMVVISGQVKYSTTIASIDVPLRQLGDQEFDIVTTVSNMTKYSKMLTDPSEIAYELEKALYVATHGRPGPVWLDIPLNVQASPIDEIELSHFDAGEAENSLIQQERVEKCSRETINKLFELIANAESPVILAGGGIRTAEAYDEFKGVVEMLGIPVCTAWNAHDLMADDDQLYAGRPGTVGTRGGNFVVQNADLVLSFACRMNLRQISYNWEKFAPHAKIVAVDIDQAELDKPTVSIDYPIHADIKDFFGALLQEKAHFHSKGWPEWLDWCHMINEKYPACLPEYRRETTPVNIYVFMDELSKHLPSSEVIVASNGSACVCAFQALRINEGQRLFTNSGCAAMGYGLPAAVGAAVAEKGNRPVLCIEGDGSLMMNLQELETASFNNLDLKIVVINNDGYHSIRQTQKNTFQSNFCGIDESCGVGFPKWSKVAETFGFSFVRIDSLKDTSNEIDKFLMMSGSVMLEVVVGAVQDFAPKLGAKKLPDGSMISPSLEDMSPFLPREEMEDDRYHPNNKEGDQ